MTQRIAGGAVVADVATGSREWLQAADILLARHRTLRLARRWLWLARLRYPGCAVVVSRQRGGRWCLVGLPNGVSARFVHSRRWTPEDADRIGRICYETWLSVGSQWSEEEVRR